MVAGFDLLSRSSVPSFYIEQKTKLFGKIAKVELIDIFRSRAAPLPETESLYLRRGRRLLGAGALAAPFTGALAGSPSLLENEPLWKENSSISSPSSPPPSPSPPALRFLFRKRELVFRGSCRGARGVSSKDSTSPNASISWKSMVSNSSRRRVPQGFRSVLQRSIPRRPAPSSRHRTLGIRSPPDRRPPPRAGPVISNASPEGSAAPAAISACILGAESRFPQLPARRRVSLYPLG
jgi:hypothetical protein